jgi:hypothetical protein
MTGLSSFNGTVTGLAGRGIEFESLSDTALGALSFGSAARITGANGAAVSGSTVNAALTVNSGAVLTGSTDGISINRVLGNTLIEAGSTIIGQVDRALEIRASIGGSLTASGELRGRTSGVFLETASGRNLTINGAVEGETGSGVVISTGTGPGQILLGGTISGGRSALATDTTRIAAFLQNRPGISAASVTVTAFGADGTTRSVLSGRDHGIFMAGQTTGGLDNSGTIESFGPGNGSNVAGGEAISIAGGAIRNLSGGIIRAARDDALRLVTTAVSRGPFSPGRPRRSAERAIRRNSA